MTRASFVLCSLLSIGLAASAQAALKNTSSRGTVGTGDNVLISGFVVDAPPGQLRWLLVRAVGPTLGDFGVSNTVADPAVWLYDRNRSVIGSNNSMADAPNLALMTQVSTAAGAFPLTRPVEASLLVGVPAGNYTAVARAQSGSAGTGLLEVYDFAAVDPATASQTVSGIAASNPSFTTLATALRITGLDAVLSSGGPFTVFAPTDAAFAKLPAATLQSLIANPTQLANVLRYHVVSGRVLSTSLSNNQQVTTLLAGAAPLTVTLSSSGAKIGPANITAVDVPAINGVVHVIDTVLVP